MKNNILDGLNSVQREAAANYNGASLIVAGAGSGKTRVLTFRIAYMIEQGVAPSSIMALTFTNKAACEMKERITAQITGSTSRGLWVGTFHSIFSRILRNEAELLGFTNTFTIYDASESRTLVKNIIKEMSLNDEKYKPKDIASRISKMKNDLITPNIYIQKAEFLIEDREARRMQFVDVYREYMIRCKRSNAMDFDDLLLYTNLLFKNNPNVVKKYQEQFKYVLVDEYQDTNMSQYLIIKKITEYYGNVCVVGDDAQSIYSFRGAKIENILRFQNDYKDAKVYKLEQNYRSTQTIVNAANSVIAKNTNQIKKSSFSENQKGELINLLRSHTEKEEAMQIASSISEKIKYENNAPKEFAILYRTNAQSRSFEDALRQFRIPYKIYGGLSFYKRKEVKDVLAYVRLVVNQNDDEALSRIINIPARGIGAVTIQKITDCARANNFSMWQALATHSPEQMLIKGKAIIKLKTFGETILLLREKSTSSNAFEVVSEIVERSGLIASYKEAKTTEAQSACENIESLVNSLKQAKDEAEAEGNEPIGIVEWLQDVALITDMDNEGEEDNNKVTLMTIHASKGLEYRFVSIVGMEEGLFPSPRTAESIDSLEEERRLFYVAITRAVEELTISYALSRYQWGSSTHVSPSRFLKDIDKKHLNSPELLTGNRASSVDIDNEPVWQNKNFTKRSFNDTPNSYNPTSKTTETHTNTNLKKIEKVQKRDTAPANISELVVGIEIFHKVFGKGVIIDIEQTGNGPKASVDFTAGVGRKMLLLNFAKVEVFKEISIN